MHIYLALAVYFIMVIPYLGYVPIWDSLEDLEEYLFLPRQHLVFDNLLLMHNGHPSLGYFWPFWIGQTLFPSQMMVVNLINFLFGSLAIIAFGKVAAIAFHEVASRLEMVLITVAFAVHPVFIAYAINISPDYGILAYFLTTLWLLYAGRAGWATLAGTLLIFSKEVGVLSYGLLVVVFLSGAFRKYPLKSLWPLAGPFLALGIFCLYQLLNQRHIFPWMSNIPSQSVWDLYLPNPFKADFKMACLGPFIFEFQWIFTAVIITGLVRTFIFHRPLSEKTTVLKAWFKGINPPFRCFVFLLSGCLYIDSRVVIFTNQRYFIVLYPLIILSFFAALIQLGISGKMRAYFLAGSAVLLLLCNFRTLDPLSRSISGTFPFGDHAILSIGTIRPDFGDLNRDETVYNLEHTNLPYLLDMAFEKIKPTDRTVIVMPGDSWWIMSRLDAKSYHRTESTEPPFIRPQRKSPQELLANSDKPPTIFVLALPYFDNEKIVARLGSFYQIKERHLFIRNGYSLQVFEMTMKPKNIL